VRRTIHSVYKKRSIASDILNGADDVGAAEFADVLA